MEEALIPQDDAGDEAGEAGPSREDRLLLLCCNAVLLSQYIVVTVPSSYFPQWGDGHGMGTAMVGLVFAVQGAGTVIASVSVVPLMDRLGVRHTIVGGLLLGAAMTALFGLSPVLLGTGGGSCTPGLLALFVGSRLLNGFFAGCAEVGAYAVVTSRFRGDGVGKAMAGLELCAGLGCMIGPVVGGTVYSAARGLGTQAAFAAPMLACAVLAVGTALVLRLPALHGAFANGTGEEGGAGGRAVPVRELLRGHTAPIALNMAACLMSGAMFNVLAPTLPLQLQQVFGYDESSVGRILMIPGGVFLVLSMGVGTMMDNWREAAEAKAPGLSAAGVTMEIQRKLHWLLAAAFFLFVLGFLSLGPVLPPGSAQLSETELCTKYRWTMWLGLSVYGLGCVFSLLPTLPLIQAHTPKDNEHVDATLSGWWNGAYAAGAAIGPLLGGALNAQLDFSGQCAVTAVLCLLFSVVYLITMPRRVPAAPK